MCTTLLTLHKNINPTERIISVGIGTLLLVNALKEKKNITKGIAGGYLLYRGITGYCPASQVLQNINIDLKGHNINIKTAVTVNKPRNKVYAFWRNLSNLPIFMNHIKSIDIIDDSTSEWTAKVAGGEVKWKSKIVHDAPNERIGWQSERNTWVENAGNIHFVDAGDFGTEVHVVISYHAPAGKLGENIAHLFHPLFTEVVKEEIKNFKRYIETGEIPTIKGQPSGK